MHQGLNFGVRNALKLTYEHVTVRKNFPGATPPGPPGGGRGGEGRGMGEGKAEGGGGRGMGEYGEGRAGVRIQTFEFRPPSISSLKVGLVTWMVTFTTIRTARTFFFFFWPAHLCRDAIGIKCISRLDILQVLTKFAIK
jgi:hypothetical protein